MVTNLIFSGVVFILRQIFAWRENIHLKYLFTPLATFSLMWPLFHTAPDNLYTSLMSISIFFCLIGDICLMLDNKRVFYYGVVSFGIAQILFITNFTIHGTASNCSFLPIALILGVIFLVVTKATNLYRGDKIVFFYGALLFTTVLMSFYNSYLAFIGAFLFLLSDLLILLNMMKPYKHATVYVAALYGPAILCLMLSAL